VRAVRSGVRVPGAAARPDSLDADDPIPGLAARIDTVQERRIERGGPLHPGLAELAVALQLGVLDANPVGGQGRELARERGLVDRPVDEPRAVGGGRFGRCVRGAALGRPAERPVLLRPSPNPDQASGSPVPRGPSTSRAVNNSRRSNSNWW